MLLAGQFLLATYALPTRIDSPELHDRHLLSGHLYRPGGILGNHLHRPHRRPHIFGPQIGPGAGILPGILPGTLPGILPPFSG